MESKQTRSEYAANRALSLKGQTASIGAHFAKPAPIRSYSKPGFVARILSKLI